MLFKCYSRYYIEIRKMSQKILFINNATESRIIPGLLARAGYRVEAATGIIGLQRLGASRFDIVIVREIPGTESWPLCQKIRDLSNAPLIIINPHASAETCVRAINSGADYFMRRPFGPLELVARIRSLLQRASLREPEQAAAPIGQAEY
ncbi:MAG: hypothetical protein A2Z29_06910 [Chloroflexi bacterium RBG_16_56_11]|nr:MAG: hypothetical protein A2Z29_06910 [Chloroflexi bacterium RBG_16_56_11]